MPADLPAAVGARPDNPGILEGGDDLKMERRDEWLARTFVELADTLVADYDVVDFLSTLSERCVELLETVEVGLVLVDGQGRLQVMASSTERMRVAELYEVQNEEGPCFDAKGAVNRSSTKLSTRPRIGGRASLPWQEMPVSGWCTPCRFDSAGT